MFKNRQNDTTFLALYKYMIKYKEKQDNYHHGNQGSGYPQEGGSFDSSIAVRDIGEGRKDDCSTLFLDLGRVIIH